MFYLAILFNEEGQKNGKSKFGYTNFKSKRKAEKT